MENIVTTYRRCAYSPMLNCHSTQDCEKCGWNPVVKERRIKQFMRARALEMRKRPDNCPLRSYPPLDQKRNLGMVLNCLTTHCETAPNGSCRIFSGTMKHWNSVLGIQTMPSEKGEDNSNELS